VQRTDLFLSLDGVEETENDSSTSLEGKKIRHTHLGEADKEIIHCKMKDELPISECRKT
jgi:hypothetical protein